MSLRSFIIHKIFVRKLKKVSGGQEVKSHEIKMQLFQEIKFLIMRLKFSFLLNQNLQ
jgi:hypothetical protein